MALSESNTTRLLCSNAFLGGYGFKGKILEYLEDPNRGVAPELGVDFELVAKVCQFAKARAGRFKMFFFVAFIIGSFALVIDPIIGVFLFFVSTSAIYFWKAFEERVNFIEFFKEGRFNSDEVAKRFSADLRHEVKSAIPADDQNLIVYTGFAPFAGSGANVGGWSFVVDVSKQSEKFSSSTCPIKFSVDEIYEFCTKNVLNLVLDDLCVQDYYFVNGKDIRECDEILPDIYDRPRQVINPDRYRELSMSNETRIRHYKWIKVHDWNHDLVMSYFFRCSMRGNTMYVEVARYLLTPLADQYRKIDSMTRMRPAKIFGMVVESVIAGPIYSMFTPIILFGNFNEFVADIFDHKGKTRRKNIDDNRQFDYGAGQGWRQSCSSGQFRHYFQKMDESFCTKMLELALLDGIIDFLEAHNIDTSDLRARQTLIMNSGIIVQNGDVKAESLAVGTGAKAVKTGSMLKSGGKGAAA